MCGSSPGQSGISAQIDAAAVDFDRYRGDGQRSPSQMLPAPLLSSGGAPGGIAVGESRVEEPGLLARVVAAEQQLRQQDDVLAAERALILQQLPDGVVIADPLGRITLVNDTALGIYGLAASDLPGLTIDSLARACNLRTVDGLPYPVEQWSLQRAARHGETTPVSDWVLSRPDGTTVIAEGSARPVVGIGGQQLGTMLSLRDVTLQRTRERQQDAMREERDRAMIEAQRVLSERDQFLGSISHDLNTPVATIRAFAQLLLRRVPRLHETEQPLLREGLQTIEDTSGRMTSLIGELIDASRLRSGQPVDLSPQPVDLVALTRHAVDAHQHLSERHYIRLSTGLLSLIGVWDAARLERVLDNLLSNAIKYSPGGGEVLVTLAQQPHTSGATDRYEAVLQVRDRGIGIPETDQTHIFERFFRATNVGGRPGSGIGLAGARDIVQQHGGNIAIESAEGVGTAVTMRLPI